MNVNLEGTKCPDHIELRVRAPEGDGFNLVVRHNGELKFQAVDKNGRILPFRELFEQVNQSST